MVDHISPERRSWLMSQVGSKKYHTRNASPPRRARIRLRFRLHRKSLPGKPDLVFPKRRVALFVHGCFWHRHPGCLKASTPKTRVDYWNKKFRSNVARDKTCAVALAKLGWRVETIWECEARNSHDLERRLKGIFLRQLKREGGGDYGG